MKSIRTVLAILLASAVAALGQVTVGQISGKIFDASGAVLPRCKVVATSEATGLSQTITTDDAGFFAFPGLPAGSYTIKVEATGFRPRQSTGVVLDAASRRTVDFTLELGGVTESVEVRAATEQVQTNSGDVSQVITQTQLNDIALNGRNYTQLLKLTPGAVATNLDPFNLGLSTSGQSINGVRSASIYFMVDGADNMDNGANTNAIINPNLDTIAEVKILKSSYSAEFGGRSGAMVNVVTRSGTRNFHGTLFEFVRNDALDARSFFARTIAPLRFNDFGWTLGGPVYIPGKWNNDRSKLFFFAGQEWKYSHAGATNLTTVPTIEERNGNFQNSTLAAPIDPLNGVAFPNRSVPAARWSKNGPLLLKPYPVPNFAGPGGNYNLNGTNRTDTREDLIKIDYILSPKDQLSYRWTHDNWAIWNAFQGGNTGIVPGGRPRPGYTTVLSYTHTFSPTVLNYVSFSVTHNAIAGQPQNTLVRRDTLGLTIPEVFPANQYQVAPDVNIAGFTGYNVGDRIKNLNATFQWRDDFTKVAGAHTLKFGAQITRSRKDQNNSGGNENGVVTFNTSTRNTTRNVIADALLGNFFTYTEGQADQWWWSRFTQMEFYGQDSWRVNRKLTLEAGLRYNIIQPIYSALGNFSTFQPWRFDPAKAPSVSRADGSLLTTGDPYNGIAIFGSGFPEHATGRILAASNPELQRLFVGLPAGGVPTPYGNFGPRFGFAYDPMGDGKSSVRGGFGIFYDVQRTDFLRPTSVNPPFASSANITDGNIDNPAGGAASKNFPPDVNGITARMPAPMIMSFNLGVQRQLPGSMIVDVGYVGTLGRHLIRTININQLRAGALLLPVNSGANINALRPYPGYGNIFMQEVADNSNYNSLQVAANRRMHNGLAFGVSYTFSRTLDTSSGTPQDSYIANADYGLSAIHRAHVLNFNYVYELPFFRKATNRALRYAVGGWEFSGVTSFQSGAPNTVSVPFDAARNGSASSRATVVGDPNLPEDRRTLARWFNTEAFLPQEKMALGQYGSSGRNILIGPGYEQWDIALLKNVRFTETRALQFRAEAFNIWNHPSFTAINTSVRFGTDGKPSQNYGAVSSSGPGRTLEFGLKLMF